MSRAYSTHTKDQNLVGKPDGKDLLEDLGVNRRIILHWNLHKYGWMVCAGFAWLTTVTTGFSIRSISHWEKIIPTECNGPLGKNRVIFGCYKSKKNVSCGSCIFSSVSKLVSALKSMDKFY
jgi:hypothetical protein